MPVNNSFTWSSTAGVGDPFNTTADWVSVNNGSDQTPVFNGPGATDDFTISSGTSITGLSNITGNSLTINDPGGVITTGSAGDLFKAFLTLNAGEISAQFDGGAITVGQAGSPGTLTVGAGGTLVAGSATYFNDYSLNGGGAGSVLTGTGTVVADGYVLINENMNVSGGLTFQIDDTGGSILQSSGSNVSVLEFDGQVNGGAIQFEGASGALVLEGTQFGNGPTLTSQTFADTVSGLAVSNNNTTMLNGIAIETNNYAGPASLTAALSGSDNDILTLTDGSGDHLIINLTGNYNGDTAVVAPDTSSGLYEEGFDVFLSSVCYGAGAAILTTDGEVPVESLREGDTVITLADGAHVPQTVKWAGERTIDLTRHPKIDTVAPVRVLRGALGDNVPHRDLILSPDHALLLDGGLIPVKLLINEMTIVREMTMKSVTYHHIELEQHGILIAEGAAAESYLDTGNRAFFSNAGLAVLLHPELTINENLRCWQEDACAPLTVKPDAVKPVWQRLADRAMALGYEAPDRATTSDAAIHLLIDGKTVRPLATNGQTVSFMVPAGAKSVHLMSRATAPKTLTPWHDEPRTLGVAIRSVTLRDRTGDQVMAADHPALTAGWHAAEYADNGAVWRWTDGDATLPIKADGPCAVEITVSGTTTYLESARLAA